MTAEAADKSQALTYKLVSVRMTTPATGTLAFSNVNGERATWSIVNNKTKTYSYDSALPISFTNTGKANPSTVYWNILPVKDGTITFEIEYQVIQNGRDIADIWLPNAYYDGHDNYWDMMTQNAAVQNYNVSIRGGSPKTSYYASISYKDQDGIVKGSNSRNFGGRFNFESMASDKLKFGMNMDASSRTANNKDNKEALFVISRSETDLSLNPRGNYPNRTWKKYCAYNNNKEGIYIEGLEPSVKSTPKVLKGDCVFEPNKYMYNLYADRRDSRFDAFFQTVYYCNKATNAAKTAYTWNATDAARYNLVK